MAGYTLLCKKVIIKINQKMETLTSAASLQAFKKLQPKSKN